VFVGLGHGLQKKAAGSRNLAGRIEFDAQVEGGGDLSRIPSSWLVRISFTMRVPFSRAPRNWPAASKNVTMRPRALPGTAP